MITRLQIRNFLAFSSLSVDFNRMTVLAGTNSAGKSSLLHSIALLRQSHDAGTLPDALLLNGPYVELGTGRDVLHNEPLQLEGHEGFVISISLANNEREAQWIAAYESEADTLRVISGTPDPLPEMSRDNAFHYLRADRISPAVTYVKSHEAVAVRGSLGARGEHTANYLRVHGARSVDNADALHEMGSTRGLLDQTNAWLTELAPGTSLEVDDIPGTDFVRLAFHQMGSDVRSDSLRATNTGFGLTHALPIVVGCLIASEGDLLLVENPESHLHPRAQAILGRMCGLALRSGAQVVIETHSDHVLNAIRLSVKEGTVAADDVAIHFFTRSDEALQPTHETTGVASNGMIDFWPDGFFDQWDRAVDQLLD